ncbi:MAG: hypothetical protein ACRC6V_04015 [Bacteroidales bacterium]
MKFSVNETLIGKRLQTLDGTTAKITGVTNTGYTIEGQRKAIRVWHVTRVGGKLVQVEGAKADAKDTGKGYVTYEEEKKATTDKKDKKVGSPKKEVSSPKPSNAKKAKEADLDEEDDEAERVTLTAIDKNSAELIRTAVRDAVRGVIDCMFTNSCEIATSVMITPEDKDKIAVNMGITFELPEVEEEEEYVTEFEMSPATAKLYSAGTWEKMVEGNSKSIAQICTALHEDDAESIVHGARLVHEDGSVIFFVGVSKDKRLLAQDEDGAPLTLSMRDLAAYEVQAAPDDDEELDLGDEELDLGDDGEELDLGDEEDFDAEEEEEDSSDKSHEVSAFESKVEEIFERNPAMALKFVAKQDRNLVLTSIDTTFDINEELAEELAEFDNNELAAWYIENVYETEDADLEEEEEEEADLDEDEEEEDSEFDFEVSDDDELDEEDEEEEEDLDEDEDDTSEMIESIRNEKSVKNLVKMCHTYDIKFKKSLLAEPKAAVKILRAKLIAYLEA